MKYLIIPLLLLLTSCGYIQDIVDQDKMYRDPKTGKYLSEEEKWKVWYEINGGSYYVPYYYTPTNNSCLTPGHNLHPIGR
jgi:hypothetical protein